ncbi:LLM class flavin-dependent oxidoreductase [Pigmentiphaga sp. GD03639]|uniref:LLM class flavin-dependent oxidoreductase n=1 Tax=unclassified Pigmentiphaga TaxID=2626614 RepID=UPI001047DBD5|nr:MULTISPECIES: LLM class flavin-dependent oxidoreductase [unclassified Pigmentiphaga]MDH2236329.1 LLM class flavin-dependent oxidoreductase [Pigmentiphaga sp. GD03639]
MSDRKLHLAAFAAAGPVSGNHGGWRYPGADLDLLSGRYYRKLGRKLEAACFDLLFIADILAIPTRLENSLDSQLRYGALGALRLEPLSVLSLIAGHTEHLGLAATVSTTYFEPYDVARSLATLDHLSDGRAAWNIVTSFQHAEARNFGRDDHIGHDDRYDRADEFLEVACKLWNSWDDGALVRDAQAPLFADPAKVRPIDHHGRWFNVEGPLNVSRPPQGRPVFIQAGASSRGKDFAARWADVIFVTHASLESAREFYREMKERAAALGRDPDGLKILPGIAPLTGETAEIARAKDALLTGLADAKAGLSTLAYHLDIDLSQFPQDTPLPEIEQPGIHGHYKEVAELTRKHGMSLAQIGKQYAIKTNRDFIGGYREVADRIEQWFTRGACDGFMIQIPYLFGGLDDFANLVVPELQRRGLFRTAYEGTTLRDRLGLARP